MSTPTTAPAGTGSPERQRCTGKIVLATGAARGQGRAEVRRFAAAGADVIALDLCATATYPAQLPVNRGRTAR